MSPVRSPRLCALLASPLLALAPAVSALAAEPPSSTPLQTVDSYMRQQDGDRFRAWDALQQPVSSQQFVDLRPGDWAYQALVNLVERHGCVAGSADGPGAGGTPGSVFRGAAAITRFEAAALLHACLDTIHERTDSLQRLIREFAPELAVLQGRLQRLELQLGRLEAMPFSTTTKLTGQATFVLGGNAFSGSAIVPGSPLVRRRANELTGQPRAPLRFPDATTFNDDLQLNLDTSFTGRDLLRTNLRAGNFGQTVFGGQPHSLALAELEVAFEQPGLPNVLAINKLFYQFPIGRFITATIGPRVGQEDMLALWPSVYPADSILNVMTVNGAPAAYSKNRGAGAGFWWQKDALSLSVNYVAANGSNGSGVVPYNSEVSGGLANVVSGASASVQAAYQQEQWGLAAIWTFLQPESQFVPGSTPFTHSAIDHNISAQTQALGFSAYWQPLRSGWWPSISLGWGINNTSYSSPQPSGTLLISQSWMVGLQWTDVWRPGNDLGLAIGQPVFATALSGGVVPDDGGLVLEGWYKFQLSDAIRITPAVFYLSRPLGQTTPLQQTFSQIGALLKTTIAF